MILIYMQPDSLEGHASHDSPVASSREVRLFPIFHVNNKSENLRNFYHSWEFCTATINFSEV